MGKITTRNSIKINSNIGSALDNTNCPIHNWYKFTAGFSYKFIDYIIGMHSSEPHCIYEPFAGCGTTLVAAQEKGISAIGNEGQKFMCDIINAKLNWDLDSKISHDYLKSLLGKIKTFNGDLSDEYHPLLETLYDNISLRNLYILRDAIAQITDNEYRLFFNLALSQTLHKAALHPIAVPYIVRSKFQSHSGDVPGKFSSIIEKMLADLETVKGDVRTAQVFYADSRFKNENIKDGVCDMCITSPPYLNNLDYGEVSKVHTHFFGYTSNWHDITDKVRKHLVTGSTTHYANSDFKMEDFLQSEFAQKNKDLIPSLIAKYDQLKALYRIRNGKKSFHILMMEYFNDMYSVLKEMRRVLQNDSRAYLIMGDSAPYGVTIPTTDYLGQIAETTGFKGYAIQKIRSRGHKWKGLSHRHNVELSENILELIG